MVKKILIIFLVFQFASIVVYPQEIQIDKSWPLGLSGSGNGRKMCNFNFANGIPVVDTVFRNQGLYLTVGSVSDSSGRILFSSNGCFLINKDNDTLDNGTGLNPGNCTGIYCPDGIPLFDGNLVLPDPGSINRYYLFHQTCDPGSVYPRELYYSLIDLTLDSGRGSVINKNTIALTGNLIDGFLTATKHANGRDWWIVQHELYSDRFYFFLLTPVGVLGPYIQNIGPIFNSVGAGDARFSTDGNFLVSGNQYGRLRVFNFDRCSGTIYGQQDLIYPYGNQGAWVEFSANSHYIYLVSYQHIIQYDLLSSNIDSSKTVVAAYDGFMDSSRVTYFFKPQLAIDGKIYISCWGGLPYFHVIEYPDLLGLACQVDQHAIHLPCNIAVPPNFPNYRLGEISGTSCDSLVTQTQFVSTELREIKLFPNPSNGIIRIKTDSNIELKKMILVNCMGEKIIERKVIDTYLNISSFPPGIYFLSIEDNRGNWFQQKIIKD